MQTEILKINSTNPEPELIQKCVNILKNGGSIVYPTETLYGLGVDVLNSDACSNVFVIKNRDNKKPLIVHISNIDNINLVAVDIPKKAFDLMNKYWPGPLTIVLKKNDNISDIVSSGFNTVGVRIPNNKIELEIIKKFNSPITGTSANLSGNDGIIDPKIAFKELNGKVDIVIDGGVCDFGIPSTIVDFSSGEIKLIREGAIRYNDILKFLKIDDNK